MVQGDEVTWETIDALFGLAIARGRAHRNTHPCGGWFPQRASCRQFDAVWSVHIAGPIRPGAGLPPALS